MLRIKSDRIILDHSLFDGYVYAENGVIVDGCDGTLITWKPCDFNLSNNADGTGSLADFGVGKAHKHLIAILIIYLFYRTSHFIKKQEIFLIFFINCFNFSVNVF